jgi:hypothetical protein
MKRSPAMDKFEQLLSQQPLRSVPPGWRSQILPDRRSRCREWLWPSPFAWATVAAVWLVIVGLQLASRTEPAVTSAPTGNSATWASRQQLLNEFIGGHS